MGVMQAARLREKAAPDVGTAMLMVTEKLASMINPGGQHRKPPKAIRFYFSAFAPTAEHLTTHNCRLCLSPHLR